MPASETFPILSAGPIVPRLDFDDGPHPGAHGNATFFAPGQTDAPCESGGCLSLEGTSRVCEHFNELGPDAALAFRLSTTEAVGWRIRYRLSASVPSVPLTLVEAPACAHELEATLERTSEPNSPLIYASDWTTQSVGACRGPSPDVGMVFYARCSRESYDYRIVVEWVEAHAH